MSLQHIRKSALALSFAAALGVAGPAVAGSSSDVDGDGTHSGRDRKVDGEAQRNVRDRNIDGDSARNASDAGIDGDCPERGSGDGEGSEDASADGAQI